jgi:hypothetical protein
MDWAQLGPTFSYLNNYWGGGELPHLHADLTPACRLAQWTGYGSTGPRARANVWRRYLCNQAGLSFYEQFSMLNPDLRPSRSGYDIGTATTDLRRGLAKLLLKAAFSKDRVAVYYSMPSILGANITGHGAHKPHRYGWLWAIRDCGVQPKYITYLDVRENGISREDFDVVVLPMAMALAEEEADALAAFVEQGGTLLADAVPGVLSGHCRKLDAAPLDAVFGVTHEAAYAPDAPTGELKVAGSAHGLDLGEWTMGTTIVTRRLALSGGTALGAMDETPAFVVNRHGKGKACYLNFPMSKYLAFRDAGKESELRERVRALLEWAGARPTVLVTTPDGNPLDKLEVFRYVAGDAVIIGCVLDAEEGAQARIAFPTEGCLYDMRRGQALGRGTTFDIVLPARDALMLALLPYEAGGVALTTGRARAGEAAPVGITLEADARPGLHVFRLEVSGPDGNPIDALARNVLAEDGRGKTMIPFALNDTPGTYTVTARDVVTGVKAEGTVEVQR